MISPYARSDCGGRFCCHPVRWERSSEAGKDVYRATVKVVGERRERKLGDAVIEGDEQVEGWPGLQREPNAETLGPLPV